MKNIAIFASGNGSNAENLIRYFAHHPTICIKLLLTNKADAYALQRAANWNIPARVFNRYELNESTRVIDMLDEYHIRYIVLAGFLWLIPDTLINRYPRRIVNIHPALLPAYGGKGMYGMNVHRAVIANGERLSGITIHEVNNEYDRGTILFQASCPILPVDTPETVSEKIHSMEQQYFPSVVEQWILSTKK